MGLGLDRAHRRLVLQPKVLETAWLGDKAFDQERSNAAEWARTADLSFLAAREGLQPAILRYRALRDAEMQMMPSARDGEPFHPLWFREACRYGLVGITDPEDEIQLDRHRDSVGLWRVSDTQMDELDTCRARLPWGYALLALRDAKEDAQEEIDPEAMEALKGAALEVTLPHWVGLHVLAATFRARADAS